MAATVSVHEANETLFDAFGVERPWQGAGRPPPYPVPWYYSVESNDGGATRRPARSGRMSDIGRNIDLSRFHAAQHGAIDRALAELRAGAKTSHWMWFVFPQVAGLGTSATARRYALRDLAEARAYLADAVLRERLAAAAQAMLGWAGKRSAEAIWRRLPTCLAGPM